MVPKLVMARGTSCGGEERPGARFTRWVRPLPGILASRESHTIEVEFTSVETGEMIYILVDTESPC